MRQRYLAAMLASTAAIVIPAQAARAQEAERNYEIGSQPLDDALRLYSEVSGREVVASSTLIEGKLSSRVTGRFAARTALDRLLVGTGLIADVVNGAFVIHPGVVGTEVGGSGAASESIIVTGTRIRGTGPIGSPVTTIDRTAIEKSGMSSAQQILQALPQAFGGGPNEVTLGATTRNGAGTDGTYAASINLRGLGPSSTLVLIDGSRPALGGLGGVFADISLIPVSAIDRMEVLTDGASAIYGADAVAGVVNIRLRSDFEGAETTLRAGSADGDLGETLFAQLFGKSWSRGHLVLAYQFSQRGALAAADRSFATEDLSRWGGPDYRSLFAVPGLSITHNSSLA